MSTIRTRYWDPFVSFYLDKTPRERVLVSIISAVVIYITLMLLIHDPIQNKTASIQSKVTKLTQEKQKFAMESKAIQEADLRIKKAALEKDLKAIDNKNEKAWQSIQAFSKNALSPQKMVIILESILKTHANIQLLALENQPPQPAYESSQLKARLYKHSFTLRLKANYLELLQYLKSLESSPYPLFWDSVHFETGDYPQSTAEFLVYTFSESPSFIGVTP